MTEKLPPISSPKWYDICLNCPLRECVELVIGQPKDKCPIRQAQNKNIKPEKVTLKLVENA